MIEREQPGLESQPDVRPERWRLGVALAALAAAAALVWWAIGPGRSRQPAGGGVAGGSSSHGDAATWRTKPGFIGSAACRECHPGQFASHQQSPHGNSLQEVAADSEPVDGVFDHAASGMRFRSRHTAEGMTHEASLLLTDGREFGRQSFALTHRIGSGRTASAYLIATDGRFLESPITWWCKEQAWGMSPGYDVPQQPVFRRAVNESCLGCHAGLVNTRVDNDLRFALRENAIGCERCHGPGQAHAESESTRRLAAGEPRPAIVNLKKLPRRLSDAVCRQCHLQGHLQIPARGMRPGDFEPGEPLEGCRHDYRIAVAGDTSQLGGHPIQLEQSACYRKSETLGCTTCHNPHAAVPPADRPARYRAVCLTCHGDENCRAPLAERTASAQNNCVQCHMPASSTQIPHVPFTHHTIGIHPLKLDSPPPKGDDRIVPLFDLAGLPEGDRERSLGLAWQQLSVRGGDAGERRQAEQRAVDLLSRLPEEFVDDAVAGALADLHQSRNETPQAEQAAWRVLEFARPSPNAKASALAVLGVCAYDAAHYAKAVGYFRELNGLRKTSRDLMRQALCEYRLGDSGAAIRTLLESIEFDPATIPDREFLAAIYREQRESEAERRIRSELRLLKRLAERNKQRKSSRLEE
ncbi:MAG: hypothetical protein HY290_16345 [Planctomycetia bacterium]|nr:hypothetical protein [Planctomycetia bacterium]